MLYTGNRRSVSQQRFPSWIEVQEAERDMQGEDVQIDKEAVQQNLSAPPFKLRPTERNK